MDELNINSNTIQIKQKQHRLLDAISPARYPKKTI